MDNRYNKRLENIGALPDFPTSADIERYQAILKLQVIEDLNSIGIYQIEPLLKVLRLMDNKSTSTITAQILDELSKIESYSELVKLFNYIELLNERSQ